MSTVPFHIWTIGDRLTASTRLRILQYLPLLERDGIRSRVHTIPKGYLPRLWLKLRLGRNAPLLVQKKLFSAREIGRLRSRVSRLVFDVDDAIHLDGQGSSRNRDRFAAVTGAADRVLAGNGDLAGACAKPNRVRILPTPVDTTTIQPGPWSEREDRLLVWIGSRTNLENLPRVMRVFQTVAPRYPGARLIVLSDRPPKGLGNGIEFLPWSLDAERQLLRRAATGLMPLEDTPFNRGKCGFKILLYQAAGLAVLASPVGVNRELIDEGREGYLPVDEEAWQEALERVLEDRDHARTLGEAGRARVETTHALEVLYPQFRTALTEAS